MAKRIGGYRRKTRHLMKKSVRMRGKVSISSYMQTFNKGDRVVLKAEPAFQKGLFNLRFQGRVGIVIGKRGKCYEVEMYDFDKKKILFIPAVHLVKSAQKKVGEK